MATTSKNLVNAIKELGRGIDTFSIITEFEWQDKGSTNIKDLVIAVASLMVFVFNKAGSAFIQLVHSAEQFGGVFNPVEYQGKVISFVGDMIHSVNPAAILVEDDAWNWTKAKVVKEVTAD